MTKYAYEDMSPDQFENLVIQLCHRLLGIATQGFAPGADGGRDGKFEGLADLYPSTNRPWDGTVIIQAKHTRGYNKSFSDSEFFSVNSDSSTILEEIPKIKRLRDSGELDHYLLFANRRLTANKENEIKQFISSRCGVPVSSIGLCGIERLESWLQRFPDAAKEAGINPIDFPLMVSSAALAEIVEALAANAGFIKTASSGEPVDRVTYERKNELNNMGAEYAKEFKRRYLKHTKDISDFLAAPENSKINDRYQGVVEDFQFEILSKKESHHGFEKVVQYLRNLLFDRDSILSSNRVLTTALLFYMYWNCDIGVSDDAEANEALTS